MTARRRRPLLRAGLIGAGAGVAVALGQNLVVQGVDALLPNVQRVSSYNRPGTVTVLSADGQVIQKPIANAAIFGNEERERVRLPAELTRVHSQIDQCFLDNA